MSLFVCCYFFLSSFLIVRVSSRLDRERPFISLNTSAPERETTVGITLYHYNIVYYARGKRAETAGDRDRYEQKQEETRGWTDGQRLFFSPPTSLSSPPPPQSPFLESEGKTGSA